MSDKRPGEAEPDDPPGDHDDSTQPGEIAEDYQADRWREPDITTEGFDTEDIGQILAGESPTFDPRPKPGHTLSADESLDPGEPSPTTIADDHAESTKLEETFTTHSYLGDILGGEDAEPDEAGQAPAPDPTDDAADDVESVMPDLAPFRPGSGFFEGETDDEVPSSAPAAGTPKSTGSRLLYPGLSALALFVVLTGLWAFFGDQGEDIEVGGESPATSVATQPTDVEQAESSPSPPEEASPETSVAIGPCEAEIATMEFTSQEVGLSIPETFTQRNAYELGFPTPSFDWSAAPEGTTEIGILVHRVSTDADRDLIADGSELWLTVVPRSQRRWIVTGIDPSATSLPASSLANPLPDGVVEQDHNTPAVTIDDVRVGNKYVGAGSGARDFLFTVFALCEPDHGAFDAYGAGWFRTHAIAIGWFASSLE